MPRQSHNVALPAITQEKIAEVCAATDDPAPVHLDNHFATEVLDYPSVLVPGSMLLGWVGEYLEDLGGGAPDAVSSLKVRFTSPVWLGDDITLAVELGASDGAYGTIGRICDVIALRADGTVVARIEAELTNRLNDSDEFAKQVES